MISAKLEERLVKALEAAIAEGAPGMARRAVVRGLWQQAGEGGDGKVLAPVGALVEVSVAPPQYEVFSLSRVSLAVEIGVGFKSASKAAAMTTVVPTCAAIERRLAHWHLYDNGAFKRDLAFVGFNPVALESGGGTPPRLDEAAGSWNVGFSFTIKGIVERNTK